MTVDPYPDLAGAEPHDVAEHQQAAEDQHAAEHQHPAEHPDPDDRPELSEADSRLLHALSQAGPAVVTAVEDEPRTAFAVRAAPPRGRSPLAPVFREPTA